MAMLQKETPDSFFSTSKVKLVISQIKIIFLTVIALLLSACATTMMPLSGIFAEEVKLSDYFALRNTSPLLGRKYVEVLFKNQKNNRYEIIGTTENPYWDKPFTGKAFAPLKMSTLAISKDGKSILYWHKNASFFSQNKDEGIYWHQVGKDEVLLYPDNELGRSWTLYDKPLPKNIMVPSSINDHEDTMALYAKDASLKPLGLYGGNQLHEAVYINDFKQVRALVKQGVDLNALTYWTYSPLDIAIKKGFDNIAIYLIEQGADYINAKRHELFGEHSTIEAAVFLQRWKVLNAIRKKGTKLDNPELFFKALFYNHGELIADNTTQVHDKDIPKMIHLLIDDGNNPRTKGLNIITKLIRSDRLRGSPYQLEVLNILLQAGVSPNAIRLDKSEYNHKTTALHHIAIDRKWDIEDAKRIMRLLAKYSKHLEYKDKDGNTALQYSMLRLDYNGSYEKALYLIELGASDTDEYLFGPNARPTGITIREKLVELSAELR